MEVQLARRHRDPWLQRADRALRAADPRGRQPGRAGPRRRRPAREPGGRRASGARSRPATASASGRRADSGARPAASAAAAPCRAPRGVRSARHPWRPERPGCIGSGRWRRTSRSAGGSRRRERRRARRPAGRAGAEEPRGQQAVHPLGRAPVLDLRRLQGGGDRRRRHPPRAVGRLRGDRLGEGDAAARRLRPDRGLRRDERDERDRQRPGRRRAADGDGRPGARDALGLGLAAGDRSPALRRAAGEVGGDGQGRRTRSPR